jgi:hypothetical protein
VGVAGISSIIAVEMLLARFAEEGGDAAATATLLDAMGSPAIIVPLAVVTLGLFIGAWLFAVPFMLDGDRLRWPATLVALGLVLILIEIVSAQVVFSQVGNVIAFFGSAWIGWLLLTEAIEAPAKEAPAGRAFAG